jgi:hypothetical protein
MNPPLAYSTTAVLRVLSNEYPAEVGALVTLPEREGSAILRAVILENPGLDEEDAAARVAEKLRELLGIEKSESELVTKPLSQAAETLFLKISESIA